MFMPESDQDIQTAVTISLMGLGTYTQGETLHALVRILRSDERMNPQLREALASCLDAGVTGENSVRLRLEAPQGYFKSLSTVAANKRMLKAGHMLEMGKQNGQSYQSQYSKLRFVEDPATYARRARKFYSAFLSFIRSDHPDAAFAQQMAGNHDPIEDDDARAFAFSRFSELQAGFETNEVEPDEA